jgi:hypothetical protein
MHSLLGIGGRGGGTRASPSLSLHHRVASSDHVLKIRLKCNGNKNRRPRVAAFGGWGNPMPSRPSRAEQFRANADECERRAINSRDPQPKAQFMDLASHWRHLAGQVESIAHDRECALKTMKMLRTAEK